jgi:transposase
MKFKTWVVEQGGAKEVSKILGVTPHTVRTWLRSEATPRVEVMARIITKSKNKIKYQDIIKETAR